MTPRSAATSIDEHVAEFPPETAAVLERTRAPIRAAAPDAVETISYAIPTFITRVVGFRIGQVCG